MAVWLFVPFAHYIPRLFIDLQAQTAIDRSLQLIKSLLAFGTRNNKIIRIYKTQSRGIGSGQAKEYQKADGGKRPAGRATNAIKRQHKVYFKV
jgi:hypothetical protein